MMNEILDYANSLGHPYKYDSCKKLTDNWNGSAIYVLISKEEEGLCLGWPTMIRETNGKLEQMTNHKEMLKIMAATDES